MTIEQLIEEELSIDRDQEPADQPIGVSVDRQTGEFELITPPEQRSPRQQLALASYIN